MNGMVITYHGENYFKITSGDYTVLVDPTNQRSYKGAQAVLFTEKKLEGETPGTENARLADGQAFIVDHAGEYEIGGVSITGFHAESDKTSSRTIYRIAFDDIVIGVLGKIAGEPGKEFTERLEGVDIAIAPIGGKPYAPVAAIAKFLRQIEPGIIVPSLYSSEKDLKAFYKEFGAEAKACDDKLVLKKKNIKAQAMEVRCLKSE